MTVATKLQLKAGQGIAVLGAPQDIKIDLPAGAHRVPSSEAADAIIVFVRTAHELDEHGAPAIAAALGDRLTWVAYPKAGQLGTDLNRDVLARLVSRHGVRPVRQVAIDDVWSALRFRPAAHA
jgi:hypothetical protein